MKHKIMTVMARREREMPLSGRVEMDDTYLGGVRSGGKRVCGAADKTPFVAAVSTSPEGQPRKVKAGGNQGLPQAQIRARRQALTHPWNGSCHSRPRLLERTRRGRPQPSSNPHLVGPKGGPNGAIQMGEHDAPQYQERGHRDVLQARPRPCRTPISPVLLGAINSRP